MLGADWRVASDWSAVLDALLDRAGGLNSSQKIKNERQEYKIGTVCVCMCVCVCVCVCVCDTCGRGKGE
jgi:hypothetical protein